MHLIIGYGNIGRRHERTLKSLGESVCCVDTGFDYSGNHLCQYSSVLICTPPNTHLDILNKLVGLGKPIFIEKPICTGEEDKSLYNRILERFKGSGMTHVACNYRFARAYSKDIRFVEYGYIYKNKYSYLDLIHMVDLCWERYGKPIKGSLLSVDSIHNLTMLFNPNKLITIVGNNQSEVKYGRLNGFDVDVSDGFENQMRYWIEFVRGRTESVNPIGKAFERTEWLIELAQNAVQ